MQLCIAMWRTDLIWMTKPRLSIWATETDSNSPISALAHRWLLWLTLALLLCTTSRRWINKHKAETFLLQPWLFHFPNGNLLLPNLLIFKQISATPWGKGHLFWDMIKQHILKVSRVIWRRNHTVLDIQFTKTACIHSDRDKSSPQARLSNPAVITAV